MRDVTLPTELVGSIPRSPELLTALETHAKGALPDSALAELQDRAVAETIRRLEELGSPVVTDGEQSKPGFATYPVAGSTALDPDGVVIPFADAHEGRLPVLTAGPFRYHRYADTYLRAAQRHATVPVKQAVIAASALSLLYPPAGIRGYTKSDFLADLVDQAEADIRGCLDAGAHMVQMDFTEGRLSLKLDPGGGVLKQFIDLNNEVLDRFTEDERARIGVHSCPGGDPASTRSLDVDCAGLLPELFQLRAGAFYLRLAGEADPDRVLSVAAEFLRPGARVFVGVTDPVDPRVETPEQVRDRVLTAARYLPPDRLGTCDDCGFPPYADDTSTSRETAFAKIRARIEGTAMASRVLGS